MNGEGLENLMGTAPGYDDDDEEEDDIEVIDTDWSGQAGMDITLASSNNWGDIAQRKGLAFGDFAALTVFAWIGRWAWVECPLIEKRVPDGSLLCRSSHGSGAIDFGVLQTALPFYLGWFGVSPLLGSYANEATANQGEMIKKLAPAWGVSIPAGIAIRGLYKGEVPPVPFMVVSMVATGVALAAWRGAYTAVNPTSTANKRGGLLDGFKMVTTLLKRW
ncbi:unnamed protein product [Chrysoparadoxa australica]